MMHRGPLQEFEKTGQKGLARLEKAILKEQQVHLTGENGYEKIQQQTDKSDI